ncbi:MAG: YceI family protein [Myxococcota bacterium]
MTLLWIALAACTTDVGEGKPKAEIVDENPPTEQAEPDAAADAEQPAAAPSTTFEVPALSGNVQRVAVDKSSIDALGAKITAKHPIKIHKFDGAISTEGDDVTGVAFVADVASLEADVPKLTEHLKTEDFLDVAKWPVATFVSTDVKPGAEGGTHTVTGDLMVHGKTIRVSFPATFEVKPEEVTAKTEFVIDRQDFGVTYPGKPDDLVQDNVVLTVSFVAPRTAPTEGDAAEAPAEGEPVEGAEPEGAEGEDLED